MDHGANSPLWDFTLRFYRSPGVAEACLAVQDRHQADVTLLIFGVWVGAEKRAALTPDHVQAAADAVAAWHSEIVRPLRAVRRRMKTGPAAAPDAQTEALRDKLKAVEIGAEKIELSVLEGFAPLPGDLPAEKAIRSNLTTILAAAAVPDLPAETAAALETLVQAGAAL